MLSSMIGLQQFPPTERNYLTSTRQNGPSCLETLSFSTQNTISTTKRHHRRISWPFNGQKLLQEQWRKTFSNVVRKIESATTQYLTPPLLRRIFLSRDQDPLCLLKHPQCLCLRGSQQKLRLFNLTLPHFRHQVSCLSRGRKLPMLLLLLMMLLLSILRILPRLMQNKLRLRQFVVLLV